mgnify:CR=1 FL=1
MENSQNRKLQPYQSFILITAVMIIFLGVQTAGIFFLKDNLYLYQAVCEILGLAIPVLDNCGSRDIINTCFNAAGDF